MPKCAKWEPIKYSFLPFLCGLLSAVLLVGCASTREKVDDEKEATDSSDLPHVGDATIADPGNTVGMSGSKEPIDILEAGGTGGKLGGSGSGAEERVQQDRVSFIIYNNTSQTKYLHTRASLMLPIACDVQGVEKAEGCFQPFCTASCRDAQEAGIDRNICGIECDELASVVRIIEPGQSTREQWNGKTYAIDNAVCSPFSCFWEIDPLVGEYRVFVEVYDEYTCDLDLCPTNVYDTGTEILGARVQGEPSISDAYFSVPYPDAAVTITIEETQCSEESHGQVQCADYCGSDEIIQSVCVQGRWTCAVGQIAVEDCPPDTCWGPPGICP